MALALGCRALYSAFHTLHAAPSTCREDALAERGYRLEDVRWVLNTHLHVDHAGGNTFRGPDEIVALSFPRVRYVVQKGELDFTSHTNERTAASYLAPNFATVPF